MFKLPPPFRTYQLQLEAAELARRLATTGASTAMVAGRLRITYPRLNRIEALTIAAAAVAAANPKE